jgi:hypothetical protein
MSERDSPWDADGDSDIDETFHSSSDLESVQAEDPSPTVWFTVTNPRGTVTATATLGGRFHRVELAATAKDMTEAELADEITVLAGLASRKAQAAQHAVIVELMRSMGHDHVSTSGFLEYTVGLPSPSTVETHAAEVFAARYPVEQD